MSPDNKSQVKIVLLLLLGSVLMFFTVKDILSGVSLPLIGARQVRFADAPNEFLLTVAVHLTIALAGLYQGVRLVLRRM